MGYPETIFFNGKVVSMDDATTSTSPGHIYQAIAVKRDTIMKVGTNDEVKALAGPNTKAFDLKGRTMTPSIIEPHSHIYGAATRYASRFGLKFPPNGITVTAVADPDLEKTNKIIKDTITEAAKKVKVGEWIFVRLRSNEEHPGDPQFWGMTRRLPDLGARHGRARIRCSCSRAARATSTSALKILNSSCRATRRRFRKRCTASTSARIFPASAGSAARKWPWSSGK